MCASPPRREFPFANKNSVWHCNSAIGRIGLWFNARFPPSSASPLSAYPGFRPADKGLHSCVHRALIRQANEGFFFELNGGSMKIQIYDTTLRDGTQGESVAFSVQDKLRVARKLDEFGISYIEGGWPGSNDKDAEFFRRAASQKWQNA